MLSDEFIERARLWAGRGLREWSSGMERVMAQARRALSGGVGLIETRDVLDALSEGTTVREVGGIIWVLDDWGWFCVGGDEPHSGRPELPVTIVEGSGSGG